jgi:hypothetical protein
MRHGRHSRLSQAPGTRAASRVSRLAAANRALVPVAGFPANARQTPVLAIAGLWLNRRLCGKSRQHEHHHIIEAILPVFLRQVKIRETLQCAAPD